MDKTLTLEPGFKTKYNIKNVIGSFSGAQKDVFIVELNSGQKVAIKIFRSFGDRENKEIETYEKYHHLDGIPKVIEVSKHGENVILIEEYIEGEILKDKIKSGFYKGDGEKISLLLKEIILILKPMWEDGLVHRDLKPENIIITPNGSPVVIDFGILKDLNSTTITETGFQPNSWKFAAPEQLFAKKEHISYRTDFFSIGVIGYYLYYGELPFGQSREDIHDNLNRSDLSIKCDENCTLQGFCSQACRINPSERPRNVELLLSFL